MTPSSPIEVLITGFKKQACGLYLSHLNDREDPNWRLTDKDDVLEKLQHRQFLLRDGGAFPALHVHRDVASLISSNAIISERIEKWINMSQKYIAPATELSHQREICVTDACVDIGNSLCNIGDDALSKLKSEIESALRQGHAEHLVASKIVGALHKILEQNLQDNVIDHYVLQSFKDLLKNDFFQLESILVQVVRHTIHTAVDVRETSANNALVMAPNPPIAATSPAICVEPPLEDDDCIKWKLHFCNFTITDRHRLYLYHKGNLIKFLTLTTGSAVLECSILSSDLFKNRFSIEKIEFRYVSYLELAVASLWPLLL